MTAPQPPYGSNSGGGAPGAQPGAPVNQQPGASPSTGSQPAQNPVGPNVGHAEATQVVAPAQAFVAQQGGQGAGDAGATQVVNPAQVAAAGTSPSPATGFPQPGAPQGWPQAPQQPGAWPAQQPGVPQGWPQAPQQPGWPGQQPGAWPAAYPQQGMPGGYGLPMGPPQPHMLADWGSRFLGRLVDGLIVGVLPAILIIIDLFALTFFLSILGALLGLAGLIWVAIQEGTTGQSIGKKVAKIRLVHAETGQHIGAGAAIGRQFAHVADGVFMLGFLWPLWDERKQTFADKMLNTVVVRTQ